MPRIVLCLILLQAATSTGIEAQTEPQTGFMVHQLLICPAPNMAEIDRLSALTAPILDELRQEGMIRAWYDLRHNWGDEWNVSVVTVADSHRAWLDFWSEYLRRVTARQPNLFSEFLALCTLHKDNMYAIRDGRTGDN